MPRWDVTASQVEADTFWDAKGDLAVGSAADASVKLAVGCTGGHVLQICSCEASGLKWASAPAPTGNIDNGTSNITSGGIWSVDIDSGATINTSGGGIGAAGSLTLGVGADAGLYVSGDDLYVENKTSDNDLVFRINDGGTFTEVARIVGSVSAMRFAEIGTPAQPAGGAGGYLYAKCDGKPYWRSNEVGETDLSGGGGITINCNTNNLVLTATGTANCVQGEARLIYNGCSMGIGLAACAPSPASGTVQIWEATAGSVTPTVNAHHLIIEHSCNAGISILTPADKLGQIAFGSPSDNRQGNIVYNHCGDTMTLRTANTDRVNITAGKVFINETLNADQATNGLTINQGATGSHIMTFKSSDITHGITGFVETDTWGSIHKQSHTGGGMNLRGYTDANESNGGAISIEGLLGGAGNTTKSTAARAIVEFMVSTKCGTSVGIPASDTNSFAIRCGGGGYARFIFDIEGSGHADVEWTTFSDGRLKFNQEVVPYGLDALLQLQPKIYCKDSGYLECGVPVLEGKRRRQIGFVAQEVLALMPEAVKNICPCTSWYSLEDGKLTAVVVKAIQELNDKVTALEGK